MAGLIPAGGGGVEVTKPSDETANRAEGTTYSNNSGGPRFVSIYTPYIEEPTTVRGYIDGDEVTSAAHQETAAGAELKLQITMLIPDGSAYTVYLSGVGSIEKWSEQDMQPA